jgi:hypothetical protein
MKTPMQISFRRHSQANEYANFALRQWTHARLAQSVRNESDRAEGRIDAQYRAKPRTTTGFNGFLRRLRAFSFIFTCFGGFEQKFGVLD